MELTNYYGKSTTEWKQVSVRIRTVIYFTGITRCDDHSDPVSASRLRVEFFLLHELLCLHFTVYSAASIVDAFKRTATGEIAFTDLCVVMSFIRLE